MSELMNIIDSLRQATSLAKKDCDAQINKAVDKTTTDLKIKIIKHRDFQVMTRDKELKNTEIELQTAQKNLSHDIDEFNEIKNKLNILIESHLLMMKTYDEKIIFISTKYKRNKIKLNQLDQRELHKLSKRLNENLREKMKRCRIQMTKPDETLIKINGMLQDANKIDT